MSSLLDFSSNRFVNIFVTRWSNVGFATAFFFTALFSYFIINSSLPDWWGSLTSQKSGATFYDLLLLVAVFCILIFCLVIYSKVTSVVGRLSLLAFFSLLASVFLILVVCPLFNGMGTLRGIEIFHVYTLIVLFVMFMTDVFAMQMAPSLDNAVALTISKVILSVPLVFCVWKATNVGWVWLIPLVVGAVFCFINFKTAFSWILLDRRGSMDGILHGKLYYYDVCKKVNYRKLGLYLTLYNFLPNLFMILSESVEGGDDLVEGIEEGIKKGIEVEDIIDSALTGSGSLISWNMFYEIYGDEVPKKYINVSKGLGLLWYIASCFALYYIGNLFAA